MSSHLLITLFGCCTFLKVHRFEDRVLSELLFDLQQSFLQPAFFLKFSIFGFLQLFQRREISKKIWLLLYWFRSVVFIQNVVRCYGTGSINKSKRSVATEAYCTVSRSLFVELIES